MRAHMTEEMFASIPAMLAQGMDRKQIAAHFDTTWASLSAVTGAFRRGATTGRNCRSCDWKTRRSPLDMNGGECCTTKRRRSAWMRCG